MAQVQPSKRQLVRVLSATTCFVIGSGAMVPLGTSLGHGAGSSPISACGDVAESIHATDCLEASYFEQKVVEHYM